MQESQDTKNSHSQNPFFEPFKGFDQSIPFDKIQAKHYRSALEQAIKIAKSRIQKIKQDSDPITFQNTIEALETSTEEMHLICNVFFNLLHSDASDDLQALAPQISSLQAAFQSDILLDEQIFDRVRKIYKKGLTILNIEERRLVEKTYRSFVRNGALLPSEDKKKIRAIDQKLATLSPQFSEKNIKAMDAFHLHIENKDEVCMLPESAVAMAAQKAKQKKLKGWLFGLEMPSYIPFMTYASNRKLRYKMWKAYSSRCVQGEFDTSKIINQIVQLKHERANLLGYKTHADYVLEERMAKSIEEVDRFLEQLIEVSYPAAQKDLKDLESLFAIDYPSEKIRPWDILYYQEKLKSQKFAFTQEDLRPYFPLDQVLQGAFDLANKLYHLSFQKREDISKYHPEVDVYEVRDEVTGKYMALFYTDFFPRPTKRTGAWMTSFRDQGLLEGKVRRPHASIVCNFTRPTENKPSLLTFEESETLFHEFGHALHAILSQCRYVSLSGPHVYWDFVELPSQFMQNWLMEKPVLNTFAKHYQDGHTIPDELFQKIISSRKYMAGYRSLRQLNFALLDMAWHAQNPGYVEDIQQFEKKHTQKTTLLPPEKEVNISHCFAHIFGGGYSAGYYSYKWAEVLDADAFEYFKENGLFKKEITDSFRKNILEKGDSEDPMDLYKRFRGKKPDPKALLRRDGLLTS